MAEWTAADIPDQSGRVAVVTGANSGLGLSTARELARAGATVVLACRNQSKGQQAVSSIEADVSSAAVELMALDLSDLGSVREFSAEVGERHAAIDLLINNAGVMALPRRETADGFEMQIGTNHLGHFALTGLLMERLLSAPAPRVVTVSSGAHHMGKISFDDLHGERRYFRWSAYGQSKLANLLFAYELQRRADAAGLVLKSVAAHPGYAATHLQSAGARADGLAILGRLESAMMAVTNKVLAQDEDMGALPSLYAATVPDLAGGSFIGPDGFLEQRGYPHEVSSTSASRDPETARRLWEVSEELTGVSFELPVPA